MAGTGEEHPTSAPVPAAVAGWGLGSRGLLGAPGDVVWPRGGAVLVNQLLHHLARVVQLVKVLLEDVLLAELLQEGLALAQLVVLLARPLKQLWTGGGGGGGRGGGGGVFGGPFPPRPPSCFCGKSLTP